MGGTLVGWGRGRNACDGIMCECTVMAGSIEKSNRQSDHTGAAMRSHHSRAN
jgi:hypothetical protein